MALAPQQSLNRKKEFEKHLLNVFLNLGSLVFVFVVDDVNDEDDDSCVSFALFYLRQT